jgi:hypothetical protein
MTAAIVEYFGPQFQMWFLFAIVIGALVFYAMERLPIEVTSFGVVCTLLVVSLFPLFPSCGRRRHKPIR